MVARGLAQGRERRAAGEGRRGRREEVAAMERG